VNRQKAWTLARARGRSTSPVPAAPVRQHVLALRAAHVSQLALAAAAGCSPSAVANIERGTFATVQRRLASQLLRLGVDDVIAGRCRPKDRVPAAGAIRRVQGLLALGHSHMVITAAGGPGWDSGTVTRDRGRGWTFLRVHEAACAAYAALSAVPGTNPRTRAYAAAAGYLPPLCWDDEDLDNPHARPHAARPRVERLDLDELMWLIRAGESPTRALARCGASVSGAERAAWRATPVRRDVLTALAGLRSQQRRAAA